jgi:hypothetical protein
MIPPVIAIWTGMLFIVSLFYLDEFEYSRTQVWIWFGSYFIYPAIALWLIWQDRNFQDALNAAPLPGWVQKYLFVQGLITTLLALTLLLSPEWMTTVWPWKITRLLAQIYSAPFLSYGISSLLLSRKSTWPEIRVVSIATFIFAFGVLLASIIHHALFSITSLAAWFWFTGFTIAAIMYGFISIRALKAGGLR